MKKSVPTTVRGILFDLDGTLADTYRLYLESYRRALTPFLGRAPTNEEIIARRPSSERRFLVDWIGAENAAECHTTMCGHYAALHGALAEGLYDGAREMLTALRSAGYGLGIVTGKGRDAWNTTSAELDLSEFDVVVTEDDMIHPKPDPGGLLAAAAALELAPAEIIYIGDSVTDLDAGRRAAMQIGAALWPKTADGEREEFLEQIRSFTPEWLFEGPADVTRAFAAWC